jgi:nicotinamidase-related amidase
MDQTEMLRLATMPAVQLLAETRSALLLIDVQNRFIFGSETAPAPTARVMPPLIELLGAARTAGIPRFYVTIGHAPGAADTAPWIRRRVDMGANLQGRVIRPAFSAWAEAIPDALAPQPGEVHLTKWRTSAFYETGLEVLLRGAGIETVVMGGVASYGCIIATYIDAFSRGFFPLLCAEAVDGGDPAKHRTATDFMGTNNRLGLGEIVRIWGGGST